MNHRRWKNKPDTNTKTTHAPAEGPTTIRMWAVLHGQKGDRERRGSQNKTGMWGTRRMWKEENGGELEQNIFMTYMYKILQ